MFLRQITAFAECEYEMSSCAGVSTYKSGVSMLLLANVELRAEENRYYAHGLPACSQASHHAGPISIRHPYANILLRCHDTLKVSDVNPVVIYSTALNDCCIHMGESHKNLSHFTPNFMVKKR